jgi:methionyl-tRNA synthetase
MGKDNTAFHTVVFPCTLIGSKDGWTMLKNISTTEYLNYEDSKFSKSRGTGVFGDDAKKTGVPSEVWRYYLLVNRPEQSDSKFIWDDFMAKNNNELLANVGNFSHRCMSFINKTFDSVIPEYKGAKNPEDQQFFDQVYDKFEEYLALMEKQKIKDGLKCAMGVSQLCNVYFQSQAPWDLAKTDKDRCSQVINVGANALRILIAVLEPFMPSFSAKVYEMLNVKRTELEEKFFERLAGHPELCWNISKPGHKIGTPLPIFRESNKLIFIL